MRLALAGNRERLARATASPDLPVVWPLGESERPFPAAEAGEVVLANSDSWTLDVEDAARIELGLGESVAAPLESERVVVIEIGHTVKSPDIYLFLSNVEIVLACRTFFAQQD